MKKILKSAVSLLLAAVIFVSGAVCDGFSIEAYAAGKLSTKVSYSENGTVILTMIPSDDDNEIHYTTDGTVPTIESDLYTAPVGIGKKTLVRIAEFDEDGNRIKGIKKTVMPKIAPVTFSVRQDYENEKAYITLECETLGAKIYYTTDGSKPDKDSSLYLGEIEISEKTRIRARAYHDDFKSTATYSKTVKIEEAPVPEEPEEAKEPEKEDKDEVEKDEPAKTTVVEKDEEETSDLEKIDYKFTYIDETGVTYVTFLKAKTTNVIRYTTDGSAVTKESKKYSKRVKFTEPGVIRAKEYTASGKLVGSLKVSVKIKCAKVEFYSTAIGQGITTIAMTTPTEGADIYYTTDGTTPTPETGIKYTEPVVMGWQTPIKAVAFKDDYKKSSTSSAMSGQIKFRIMDFDFDNEVYHELADIINNYRAQNGKFNLVLDEDLTEAANVRAKELAVYMDENTRPNGTSYATVLDDYGITCRFYTQFVASHFKTAQEFFDSIVSTSAGRNILLSIGYNHTKIGVGHYKAGKVDLWCLFVIE